MGAPNISSTKYKKNTFICQRHYAYENKLTCFALIMYNEKQLLGIRLFLIKMCLIIAKILMMILNAYIYVIL